MSVALLPLGLAPAGSLEPVWGGPARAKPAGEGGRAGWEHHPQIPGHPLIGRGGGGGRLRCIDWPMPGLRSGAPTASGFGDRGGVGPKCRRRSCRREEGKVPSRVGPEALPRDAARHCPSRREGERGTKGLTRGAEGCRAWWGGTRLCFLGSTPSPQAPGQVLLPGPVEKGDPEKGDPDGGNVLFVEQAEKGQGVQVAGRGLLARTGAVGEGAPSRPAPGASP